MLFRSAIAVFFPAAGGISYWDGGAGSERDELGLYKSSTALEAFDWASAASLEFKFNYVQKGTRMKAEGSSVRCVKDLTNLPASGAGTGGYANGGNDLEW